MPEVEALSSSAMSQEMGRLSNENKDGMQLMIIAAQVLARKLPSLWHKNKRSDSVEYNWLASEDTPGLDNITLMRPRIKVRW